ncbi:hypothetical protein C8J56DRAFT_1109887, partial [Mycena floridula]
FIAVPSKGSKLWYQQAEESAGDLFQNERGDWVLSEKFERPITRQLHHLARARSAILNHSKFHGNRSDRIEFIMSRLQRTYDSKEVLVNTMLEAKTAAIYWATMICWWIVVNPDWVRMESVSKILQDTWNKLNSCGWAGSVIDLACDKFHAPFAMLARNSITFYYPWTIVAAHDVSLTRLSPALIGKFQEFYSQHQRHSSWKGMDAKVKHTFPLVANYDLLLQDSSMRADLPSKLSLILRDCRILIIPSASWKGYYLEGPSRFNIGKELIRTRAHRTERI